MYKVVIICGGTGSIALQKGFHSIYGEGTIDLHIVINAYDNGFSTGDCRRVFHERILGPSDLRKNQLTQFRCVYEDALTDENSCESQLLKLMEMRFSGDNAQDYYEKSIEMVETSTFLSGDTIQTLRSYLDFFFFDSDHNIRPEVQKIKFDDFSLSNIFYVSAAAACDNRLSSAGTIMADLLGIKDNVHLISDKSLMLKAYTQSGFLIEDEGQIVQWCNAEDKIVKNVLIDENGNTYEPKIDEGLSGKLTSDTIAEADIIIFSSGTQWSSLIPTYMHRGFNESMKRSKAKKYLVMNNYEDQDAYGVSATEICDIVSKFVDLNDFKIIMNTNAAKGLNYIDNRYHAVYGEYSRKNAKKHDPEKLVLGIMSDFFSKRILGCKEFVFDLDGTLWNETGEDKECLVGEDNLNMFPGIIVSGNSVLHIRSVMEAHCMQKRKIEVYGDYGNTRIEEDATITITHEFDIGKELLDAIDKIPDYHGKCCIRGGVILTIKPLTGRQRHLSIINKSIEKYGNEYMAKIAGHTTIDVTKKGFSKAQMLKILLRKKNLDLDNVLFIGNELIKGNEEEINHIGIHTLQIDDVFECNVFLRTLLAD